MKIEKLIVTYTDAPSPEGFSVTVPPGTYSRADLLHRWSAAYEAAVQSAPLRTIEIPVAVDTEFDDSLFIDMDPSGPVGISTRKR